MTWCTVQLTSSKTRESLKLPPQVYQQHCFSLAKCLKKLHGLYLPGFFPARTQSWSREEEFEPQLSWG